MSPNDEPIGKAGIRCDLLLEIINANHKMDLDPSLIAVPHRERWRSLLTDKMASINQQAAADAYRLEVLQELIDESDALDAIYKLRRAALLTDCHQNRVG